LAIWFVLYLRLIGRGENAIGFDDPLDEPDHGKRTALPPRNIDKGQKPADRRFVARVTSISMADLIRTSWPFMWAALPVTKTDLAFRRVDEAMFWQALADPPDGKDRTGLFLFGSLRRGQEL
jgi:hypothetical protein